jgi:nucleoside triphosphate diphosphatase
MADEEPLQAAMGLQRHAAELGFDWPDVASVWAKLDEEWRELADARNESPQRTAEEWGDVMFTLVNLARHLGIEPAAALSAANERFSARFAAVEAAASTFPPLGDPRRLVAMEACWQQAKRDLKQG